LRIVLVRKLDEQMTDLVKPLYDAPGEQRRSGFGPSLQPPTFVRCARRTVVPTATADAVSAREPLVEPEGADGDEPSSQVATPL